MEHYEDRFDFRAGDKRRPREKRLDAGIPCRACGAYVPHDYEYREQRQYPSFGVFVKLVSMFDISVDQFIHSDSGNKESQRNGGFRVGASVLAAFIAGSAKWQAGQL